MKMRSAALKLAAVAALQSQPDFTGIRLLNGCSEREMRAFLRWLDHSGLALHFLASLRDAGQVANLRLDIQQALLQRFQANSVRMGELLEDFRRVNHAFRASNIPHAFLKGFTLIPDFCPGIAVRHQSDLDILIAPESLPLASSTLAACGYTMQASDANGECLFATPSLRAPTLHDDIYQLPPQRQVEIHTSFWNGAGHVSLSVPTDALSRAASREISRIVYNSLSLVDMFLLQILHAFGHLLGSWLRLSWLWEIHYFVSSRTHEDALWQAFLARASEDARVRKAVGLVLGLTREIFATAIPESLETRFVEPLPSKIHAWIEHCGVQWALADIAGSKLTLFIHGEFFDAPNTERKYLFHRIIPIPVKTSSNHPEASDWETRIQRLIAKLEFSGGRLLFHIREGLKLAWESLRWWRILHSNRRGRVASS